MIKVGIHSEDATLQPILSSALGKEFQISLESTEDGIKLLLSSGSCDLVILDLDADKASLNQRVECARRIIAFSDSSLAVVMADDSLRSTASGTGSTGSIWLLPQAALHSRPQGNAASGVRAFNPQKRPQERTGAAGVCQELRSNDWLESTDAGSL